MRTTPKDYYKTLGVDEDADPAAIKKAYRRLAMEYHPDHNPGNAECEEKFKALTEAYGVLIDPLKRQEYDRYRAGMFSGGAHGSSRFDYSQADIFADMFRDAFARDIFEELNREFSRSGFRSGATFFQKTFFGGAVGGLARLLLLIPGPLGKIGYVLRLAQFAGSSLLAFNQWRRSQAGASQSASAIGGGWMRAVAGFFGLAPAEPPLDVKLEVEITPEEAAAGLRKEISYRVGEGAERLAVNIPAGARGGQTLRVREKGLERAGRRGDLLLRLRVQSRG